MRAFGQLLVQHVGSNLAIANSPAGTDQNIKRLQLIAAAGPNILAGGTDQCRDTDTYETQNRSSVGAANINIYAPGTNGALISCLVGISVVTLIPAAASTKRGLGTNQFFSLDPCGSGKRAFTDSTRCCASYFYKRRQDPSIYFLHSEHVAALQAPGSNILNRLVRYAHFGRRAFDAGVISK